VHTEPLTVLDRELACTRVAQPESTENNIKTEQIKEVSQSPRQDTD
jgi:hypothetical protein